MAGTWRIQLLTVLFAVLVFAELYSEVVGFSSGVRVFFVGCDCGVQHAWVLMAVQTLTIELLESGRLLWAAFCAGVRASWKWWLCF